MNTGKKISFFCITASTLVLFSIGQATAATDCPKGRTLLGQFTGLADYTYTDSICSTAYTDVCTNPAVCGSRTLQAVIANSNGVIIGHLWSANTGEGKITNATTNRTLLSVVSNPVNAGGPHLDFQINSHIWSALPCEGTSTTATNGYALNGIITNPQDGTVTGHSWTNSAPKGITTVLLDGTLSPASHLKYFGYYNYYKWFPDDGMGRPPLNLTPLVGQTNFTFVYDRDTQITSRLQDIKNAGMKAVVVVQNIFFSYFNNPWNTKNDPDYEGQIRSEAKNEWAKFKQTIAPYADTIAAFYIEEPYWSTLHSTSGNTYEVQAFHNVNQSLNTIATSYLKADFPSIPFAIADTGIVFTAQCPSCIAAIQIPSSVDWVGLEGEYPTVVSSTSSSTCSFDNCGGTTIPMYIKAVKAKMSPGQKLILSPPVALPTGDTDYYDAIDVFDAFQRVAYNDPQVVAIFPFYWNCYPNGWNTLADQPATSPLRVHTASVGSCALSSPSGRFTNLNNCYIPNGSYFCEPQFTWTAANTVPSGNPGDTTGLAVKITGNTSFIYLSPMSGGSYSFPPLPPGQYVLDLYGYSRSNGWLILDSKTINVSCPPGSILDGRCSSP